MTPAVYHTRLVEFGNGRDLVRDIGGAELVVSRNNTWKTALNRQMLRQWTRPAERERDSVCVRVWRVRRRHKTLVIPQDTRQVVSTSHTHNSGVNVTEGLHYQLRVELFSQCDMWSEDDGCVSASFGTTNQIACAHQLEMNKYLEVCSPVVSSILLFSLISPEVGKKRILIWDIEVAANNTGDGVSEIMGTLSKSQ